jgi:hypothetical protein
VAECQCLRFIAWRKMSTDSSVSSVSLSWIASRDARYHLMDSLGATCWFVRLRIAEFLSASVLVSSRATIVRPASRSAASRVSIVRRRAACVRQTASAEGPVAWKGRADPRIMSAGIQCPVRYVRSKSHERAQ